MFGNKKNLHHAYLIEGNSETILPLIYDYLKNKLNFSLDNNPDYYYAEFETFGIDDGRRINELQNKKAIGKKNSESFGSGKQIFVIKTNFITREAQNSLLKMFEEPTSNTHFFIIMSSSEALLPTLKSRLLILKRGLSDNLQKDFVRDFLMVDISERLKMVKKFFGDSKKKIPADKSGAILFLNELEKQLREKIDIKKVSKKELFVFDEIMKCRSYLNDRSPSVKMLLEYLITII